MIRKLLCKLGFHKWEYNSTHDKRWCKCGKTQEKFFSNLWAECVDGEPIEDFWYLKELNK